MTFNNDDKAKVLAELKSGYAVNSKEKVLPLIYAMTSVTKEWKWTEHEGPDSSPGNSMHIAFEDVETGELFGFKKVSFCHVMMFNNCPEGESDISGHWEHFKKLKSEGKIK